MKCNKCLKQDTCKYYIKNCDKPCSHYLGLKGIWELLSRGMNDSAFVTDKFINMYGEQAVFDKEADLL